MTEGSPGSGTASEDPQDGGRVGPAARRPGRRAWSALRRRDVRSEGEEPDYRFSLANERTFLAWIRTSLALLAGGVAVIQVVPRFAVPGSRYILGVPLVLMSILIALHSHRHWADSERAMRLRRPLPRAMLPRILGLGVTFISLLALVFLLVGGRGGSK